MRKGLELARTRSPIAITLDLRLPGIDGWEVLAALKDAPETSEIPVILVSMLDEQEAGFALGASDYLTKPVDRNRLIRLIRKLSNPDADLSAGGILIVEDDDATREMIRRSLESTGWPIREADNGRTGLEAVRAERPALVILDLMMPEVDGFEFLRELRTLERGYAIPVVVVTAKDLDADDRMRLNSHVTTVLHKSAYESDALLGEIAELVRSVAATRETEGDSA